MDWTVTNIILPTGLILAALGLIVWIWKPHFIWPKIVLAAAVVSAAWLTWARDATYLVTVFPSNPGAVPGQSSLERSGLWGDSFGGLNAAFSAAGFIAIVCTILWQIKALKEQRSNFHRERFEASFFQLLGLLRQLRAEIVFQHSDEYKAEAASGRRTRWLQSVKKNGYHGPRALRHAANEVSHWMEEAERSDLALEREDIIKIYRDQVHSRYESRFGPYFRVIYSILRKIRDDKGLNDKEKFSYSRLLRGQLSSHEATLLGVNGLAGFSKDLGSLLVDFRMLKYMPEGIAKRRLTKLYPEQTFVGRSEKPELRPLVASGRVQYDSDE